MKIYPTCFIALFFFLLAGCSSDIISEMNNQLTTVSPTNEQQLGKTLSAINPESLKFDTAPGSLISSDQLPSTCGGTTFANKADAPSLKGLVVNNITTRELMVLNDRLGEEPSYTIQNIQSFSNYVAWGVSPDNHWISYIDLKRADHFDVWVENPKTGERIRKQVEEKTIGAAGIYWGNKEQIIIPLMNKGDQFEWLVWKPFSQEEHLVSIEIPYGNDLVEKYSIFPIYDPTTNSILTPCQQCEENEFQFINLDRNSVLWSIDYGKGVFTSLKWAPNISHEEGVNVFYFGLNKLWIVDNNGESLVKAIIPFGSNEGWPIKTYKWSNNGEYLAMIRDGKNFLASYLTILSIKDKKVINICDDKHYGTLTWSYDNQHIAIVNNSMSSQTESTLQVVDIKTGSSQEISITHNLALVGWIEP